MDWIEKNTSLRLNGSIQSLSKTLCTRTFILLMFVSSASLFSQSVGIKMGSINSKFTSSHGSFKTHTYFTYGLTASKRVSDRTELIAEVLYTRKGATFSSAAPVIMNGTWEGFVFLTKNTTESLTYMDFSLLLKKSLWNFRRTEISVLGGPTFSYLIAAETAPTQYNERAIDINDKLLIGHRNNESSFRPFDIAASAGVAVAHTFGRFQVSADLRGTYGFINILKKDEGLTRFFTDIDDEGVKNLFMMWSIGTSYSF